MCVERWRRGSCQYFRKLRKLQGALNQCVKIAFPPADSLDVVVTYLYTDKISANMCFLRQKPSHKLTSSWLFRREEMGRCHRIFASLLFFIPNPTLSSFGLVGAPCMCTQICTLKLSFRHFSLSNRAQPFPSSSAGEPHILRSLCPHSSPSIF